MDKKENKEVFIIYKPLPMPKGKHYGSNFWDGFSYKINRDVNFYSDLEYDHWILVETDPKIIDFCEQPREIQEIYEGEVHFSIFDMWIKWQDGTEEFREIKYNADLNNNTHSKKNKRVKIQIEIQKKWCEKNGYIHNIFTEEQIRIQPYFTNIKIMVPYLRNFKNENELFVYRVTKYITTKDKTIEQLQLETQLPYTSLNETLFYLYYTGKIKMNIHEKHFNKDTIVRSKNG